jgi:phosphomethylpyrimidine synthase
MKITQEVRDFAAKQSSLSRSDGEGDRSAQPNGGGAASAPAEAAEGMAEMSERFRETGGKIYVPAAE